MEASNAEALPGKCRDWKARQGPGVVVVDGWCTFPTGAYTTELRKAERPGADSEELVLERVVTVAEGYHAPVIRGVEMHYEEPTDVEYKKVTILPDGPTVEVEDKR